LANMRSGGGGRSKAGGKARSGPEKGCRNENRKKRPKTGFARTKTPSTWKTAGPGTNDGARGRRPAHTTSPKSYGKQEKDRAWEYPKENSWKSTGGKRKESRAWPR